MFDYGAIHSRIEKKFRKLKAELLLEYSRRKLKINEEWKYNRRAHLMKLYNEKSKEMRKKSNEFGIICIIKYFGNYIIKY